MTELILDRGGDRGQSWLSLDVSVSCWQENRHSQTSETDRSKHSGSDLQATPPGRTFLSGTCGPAPTYRWRGYPQCPGREALITLRERHLWNRREVCLGHSPLLVLEPFGSVSTPDCSQTHLQRQRHPVNHSACGAFKYSGVIDNSRRENSSASDRGALSLYHVTKMAIICWGYGTCYSLAHCPNWSGRRGHGTFTVQNKHPPYLPNWGKPFARITHSVFIHSHLKKVPEDRAVPPRSPCVRLLVWGRWRVWLLCFKIHSGTQAMEKECWTLVSCRQQMPVCKSTHLFCLLLFTLLSKFCVCNVVISIREVSEEVAQSTHASQQHFCFPTWTGQTFPIINYCFPLYLGKIKYIWRFFSMTQRWAEANLK